MIARKLVGLLVIAACMVEIMAWQFQMPAIGSTGTALRAFWDSLYAGAAIVTWFTFVRGRRYQ